MGDAQRMGLGDGVAGLQDVLDRRLDGQRALVLQQLGQVRALQVLNEHVGVVAVMASPIDPQGVLTVQLHQCALLALEAFDHFRRARRGGQ